MEEITKAVMEAENEGQARQAVSVVPASKLNVPATLHASLMARLDRLGSAKEVAQTGAAIGREFSHNLLAAVACKPGERAGPRKRTTYSSTSSSEMPHMARYCVAGGKSCTDRSCPCCNDNSPRWSLVSQSC